MDLSQLMPALKVPIDGFFIADFWGFVLALPVALFLAFWMSAVKSRRTVVLGAFAGALLGFVGILAWVDTLLYDQPLPNASAPATFFGSVLICSILGLSFGIVLDLIVARMNKRDYRRQVLVHE